MAKKKVKRTRKKKIKLPQGNILVVPRHIPPTETLWQRIYRWFCG
jgi:hypothetical protein